jgi:hypothetical protein
MKSYDELEAEHPRVMSNKNFNKIFCIGYNKTGTTTLETVLRLYGFKLPNQQEQEIRLTKNIFSTEYEELKRFVQMYDAFQDLPFSQGLTYVVVDALFPNSKFILSERDADSWFNSLSNFHTKIFNLDDVSKLTQKDVIEKFNYLYPGYSLANKERLLSTFDGEKRNIMWDKLYDRKYYVDMYTSRNQEIKRFFMNAPHKLLVIDLTKEKNTDRLCEFLNIPSELSIEMPHSNKT